MMAGRCLNGCKRKCEKTKGNAKKIKGSAKNVTYSWEEINGLKREKK
jgi:hypothetical protein